MELGFLKENKKLKKKRCFEFISYACATNKDFGYNFICKFLLRISNNLPGLNEKYFAAAFLLVGCKTCTPSLLLDFPSKRFCFSLWILLELSLEKWSTSVQVFNKIARPERNDPKGQTPVWLTITATQLTTLNQQDHNFVSFLLHHAALLGFQSRWEKQARTGGLWIDRWSESPYMHIIMVAIILVQIKRVPSPISSIS